MTAILLKLIEQLNSSVFVLLLILIAAGYGLYKIGAWSEKFFSHEKKIEGLGAISTLVTELKVKVDLIYQMVNPNSPIRSRSPISLTPVGEQIVTKLGVKAILEKCIDTLKKEVESQAPKNAYDIQMISMKIAKEKLLSCLNEKELIAVKEEAFSRGLLVEDVLSVFGVLLRDRILIDKGIPIAEVDQHAAQ